MFNYRPLQFLTCISKIHEKIIHRSLYEYCVSPELLIIMISELKRNDPTSNQLHTTTHNIINILITVNVMMYIINVREYRMDNTEKLVT